MVAPPSDQIVRMEACVPGPGDVAAVSSALFLPGEFPASLFYRSNNDQSGILRDLRTVTDLAHLPPYWTLSCPGWYSPGMGNLEFEEGFSSRKLVLDVVDLTTGVEKSQEVFHKHSPFLCFEVDYLLLSKDEAESEDVTRRKQLQAEAMAFAFQKTNFPAAVLVHSGSKSIHAYVRLNNSIEEVAAFRESPEFGRLVELAWTVFGEFDEGVMKQCGRVKLMRTPGAVRENGKEQRILGVGKPVSINDLFQWFYSQLSPSAVQEITSRAPLKEKSELRAYRLRAPKWRGDLLKPHQQGGRGTGWMHVSKALAVAGSKGPRFVGKPDQWVASWLWWVSAFAFNHYSSGWFFSSDPNHWKDLKERERWWDDTTIKQLVAEQRKFEGFDPLVAQLTDTMKAAVPVEPPAFVLPPVEQIPHLSPPPILGGVVTPPAEEKPKEKKERKQVPYDDLVVKFFNTVIRQEHLLKLDSINGDQWMVFDGMVWKRISEESLLQLVHHQLMPVGFMEKHKTEVLKLLTHHTLRNVPWIENPRAIAFTNGTLYITKTGYEFKEVHDPNDCLRNLIAFEYNPDAMCPKWEESMLRFLPDESRRAVIQEMVGYTFVPGQPFQAFFLLLGTGANFKGTLLRIVEALHGEATVAVSLSNLGTTFSLETVYDKRVAIDGEAGRLGAKLNNNAEEAVMTIKRWTGGDKMNITRKHEKALSVYMSPKLLMAANRRPRLVDPTNGVWRRLKIVGFDVTVQPNEIIADFDKILIAEEISGIVNWALVGLKRLLDNRGKFTHSDHMANDLDDYQADMDNTLQFIKDFMYEDATAEWADLRPIYQVYKDNFCGDTGTNATALNEFKNRLIQHRITVAKPPITETVHGVPHGSPAPRTEHYWAIRGWRCTHPGLAVIATQGLYAKTNGHNGTNGHLKPLQFPKGVQT